jgi:GntR family transcriptional regulator
VESVQVPQRLAPWLERFDLARNSLYRIFEESYGLKLETSIEEIAAELPSAADRKLLGIPKNVAALVINRKTFTDTGNAIELSRSTYRGDLYSAIVHSVRKRKASS